MLARLLYGVAARAVLVNTRSFSVLSNKIGSSLERNKFTEQRPCLNARTNLINSRRTKKTKQSREADRDSEDEESDEEADGDVVTVTAPSVRLENILKGAFNLSRKKVEDAFFAGRIRVNGRLVSKKSVQLNVGDEVDVFVSKNTQDPDLIYVHRVKILDVFVEDDKIKVKMERDKNLLIEEY